MLRSLRRSLKKTNGQAIAELAITLPLLIMILCAIIDFGWLFANQLALSYLSREGARYAIVHSGDADAETGITNRVLEMAPDFLQDRMTVTVTFSEPASRRSGDVSVRAEAGVAALTPVVGIFEQNQTVTLSAGCTMKVE